MYDVSLYGHLTFDRIFDGFKKVYNFEDLSEKNKNILPIFEEKEELNLKKIEDKQCFTSPPNRFSEAGLIKKLEELGIGRPSTYASIIKKLKEKNYVEMKNKSMIPNAKGKILSKFLENFFNECKFERFLTLKILRFIKKSIPIYYI